jgi:DNA-directed RNA polymerase subunit RPC12/RpoP
VAVTLPPLGIFIMTEFKTENTEKIVCPYCGYAHKDSWEYNDSSGTRVACHSCAEEFELHVEVSVEYTTERVESRLARKLSRHVDGLANNSGTRMRVACTVADYGLDKMPVGFLEMLLKSFESEK